VLITWVPALSVHNGEYNRRGGLANFKPRLEGDCAAPISPRIF
jgi:hypothetical protein